MANTMQIKCINRTERMSPPERITHIGGYESSQWKMTMDDAIAKIESDEREGSGAKFRKRFNKGPANTNRLRQRELHSRLRAPCCLCSEVRRG